jgi:transposase
MFTLLPADIPQTAKRELLQQVDRLVNWAPLREQARPFFAPIGRPSIDPVVMVKMMLAGYLLGIPSDRRLVEECSDSFALREFLGYRPDEKLPTHPNFTHWRQRLGAEFFRGLLHQVVRQLVAQGLELSAARSLDATSVKAQASKQGPVVARPVSVAVEAFVAGYFADDAPAPAAETQPATETVPLNLHEPQARLQRKAKWPSSATRPASAPTWGPGSSLMRWLHRWSRRRRRWSTWRATRCPSRRWWRTANMTTAPPWGRCTPRA